MTRDTVFVASPRAIGRRPVASGSRVPACPAFVAEKSRRTRATAVAEVMPRGLSRISQPVTAIFTVIGSAFAVLGEVALYCRIAKQLIDVSGIVEGAVKPEAQFGHELHSQTRRDEAPDVFAIAVEGGEKLLARSPGEGAHIGRGDAKIGRHGNFENRHSQPLQCGIAGFAAAEHAGKLVPDQFADTQLPLTGSAGRHSTAPWQSLVKAYA